MNRITSIIGASENNWLDYVVRRMAEKGYTSTVEKEGSEDALSVKLRDATKVPSPLFLPNNPSHPKSYIELYTESVSYDAKSTEGHASLNFSRVIWGNPRLMKEKGAELAYDLYIEIEEPRERTNIQIAICGDNAFPKFFNLNTSAPITEDESESLIYMGETPDSLSRLIYTDGLKPFGAKIAIDKYMGIFVERYPFIKS